MKLLFCDVETTGLDPVKDQIVEICVKILNKDGSQGGGEWLAKVRPTVKVSPEAAKINGFTEIGWQEAIDQDTLKTVFNDWLRSGEYQLVNWNPSFDLAFIRPLVINFKLAYHPLDILSMVWSRAYTIPEFTDSLGKLRKYPDLTKMYEIITGLPMMNAHSALGDVDACIELYRFVVGYRGLP